MKKYTLTLFFILYISFCFSNIYLEFYETPLKDALKEIEEKSDSVILTVPSIKGVKSKIINTVDVKNALDILLYGTPYDYKIVEDDVYIIGNFDYFRKSFAANSTQIMFENLDLSKVSHILSLLNQRVSQIPNTTNIVVFGNDSLSYSIENFFRYLDENAGENEYILYLSLHEISQDVFDYLLLLEGVSENNLLVNKDSIGFLEDYFPYLTELKKVDYFETFQQAQMKSENPVIKENILDWVGIETQEEFTNLVSPNQNNYFLLEKDEEYYILVLSIINLNNISKNYKTTDSEDPFFIKMNINYNFNTGNYLPTSIVTFYGNELGVSSDFKDYIGVLFRTNFFEQFRIGVSLENEEEVLNVKLFLDDYEKFDRFDLYGVLQINNQINNLDNIVNSIRGLDYDLFLINDFKIGEKEKLQILTFPGIGVEIPKDGKSALYFNFAVMGGLQLERMKISLSYSFYHEIHSINLSFNF